MSTINTVTASTSNNTSVSDVVEGQFHRHAFHESESIESSVREYLSRHGLQSYKELFQQQKLQQQQHPHSHTHTPHLLPTTLDHLILPFRLSAYEKNIKHSILDIAASKSNNNINTRIMPIVPKRIEDFQLKKILPPERRILAKIDITPSTVPLPTIATSVESVPPPAEKKRRGAQKSEDSQQQSTAKRSKRSTYKEQDYVDPYSSTETFEEITSSPIEAQYEAMQYLFDEFWNLDMDPFVAAAYFSVITRSSCISLGIPDYFEKVLEACTLPNIKERLELKRYSSTDGFVSDFMTMFNNIMLYYAVGSIQYEKTVELKQLFLEKWKLAKSKFSIN